MHSYLQDLGWNCYTSFSHICTTVVALDLGQNLVFTLYLEKKLTSSRLSLLPVIFHKFVTVIALDWGQNFVPTQYLEHSWT